MTRVLIPAVCAMAALVFAELVGQGCEILPSGAWVGEALEEHCFDPRLAQALVRFLWSRGAASIYDFGCGNGAYTLFFRQHGLRCEGFDGNPETSRMTQGQCVELELHQPVDLQPVDWVISLEVGEHIPLEYEAIFLDNLARHAKKGVVLSWAIEGQGGHGHVNCRNNDYMIEQMRQRGFRYLPEPSRNLRAIVELSWFEETLMVFSRERRMARA